MRLTITCLILCLVVLSCKKEDTVPPDAAATPVRPVPTRSDTSFIHVTVNDHPMRVTAIHYNRGSGEFDLSAENEQQKVTANCFHFYGQSGFNYQYTYTLSYCTRTDSESGWQCRTATGNHSVGFACCAFPMTDTPVKGSFFGGFTDVKLNIAVKGEFYLKF